MKGREFDRYARRFEDAGTIAGGTADRLNGGAVSGEIALGIVIRERRLAQHVE